MVYHNLLMSLAFSFLIGGLVVLSVSLNLSLLVLNEDGSEILEHCGDTIPAKVVSSATKMTIKFKSDSSVNRKGYLATWRKVDNTTTSTPARTTTASTTLRGKKHANIVL